MRRGRPSKLLASPSLSIPEEHKSGQALQNSIATSSTSFTSGISSSSTGQKNWEASFKNNSTPSWPGAISTSYVKANASGSNGFGESFKPNVLSSTTITKPSSFPSPAFNPASSPSSTLFADLLPPSTISASDGTPLSSNSVLALKSGALPESSLDRSDALKSSVPLTSPSPIQLDSSSNTFPTSFSPTTFFNTEVVPISSSKLMPELTGEDTGPPIPRRPQTLIVPPLSTKPELISRASQTSPALMASWNSSITSSILSNSPNGTARSSPKVVEIMQPTEIVTKAAVFDLLGDDDQEELNRFNSSTLVESQLPSKSSPSSDLSVLSSTRPSSQLLEASRGKFRPTKPDGNNFSDSNSTTSSTQSPVSTVTPTVGTLDVKDRFPSLDQMDSKVQQVEQWQPIVEKDEESSDDEVEDVTTSIAKKDTVEEFEVDSFPPSDLSKEKSSSSSTKFIPLRQSISTLPLLPEPSSLTSRPWQVPSITSVPRTSSPLIAPQPQSVQRQAAISSLVSRYENLSTEPSLDISSTRRAPPPLASKPSVLRRGSLGRSDRRASSGQGVVDYFEQRFPDEGELDNHSSTSTSLSTPSTIKSSNEQSAFTTSTVVKSRPLFKPVPPLPSSPGRPSSLASVIAKPTINTKFITKESEEEPEFIGVSNMRNKWESLTSKK